MAHDIDVPELKAHLARQNIPQWKMAAAVGVAPSTFSHYLVGRFSPPPSLRLKIEKYLGLPEGALLRK